MVTPRLRIITSCILTINGSCSETLISIMFYVYILQSETKHRLYIGKTTDLKRRVKEHNAGQNVSTKAYVPWTLVFYETYINQKDVSRREKYLKTTQGHQAIKRMLSSHLEQYNKIHFEYQGSTT